MRLLCIFILACTCSIHAWGQYEVNTYPIRYSKGYIYLKDGSVLKGKYLYSNTMEKIRVISGKNSWIFDNEEVDKISSVKPVRKSGEDTAAERFPIPETRWFNLTEIGVIAGNNDNSQPAPMVFGTSFNRMINRNLSAGMGIGAEFLKETYVPLTVNLLYRLRDNHITPFAMLQGGYQIPVEDSRTLYYKVVPDYLTSDRFWPGPWPTQNSAMKAKGGLLVNPSFGIMKQYSQGFGMSLAFGYRFHRLHYTAEDNYRLDIDYNRLSVKLGFIFN